MKLKFPKVFNTLYVQLKAKKVIPKGLFKHLLSQVYTGLYPVSKTIEANLHAYIGILKLNHMCTNLHSYICSNTYIYLVCMYIYSF